MKPITTSRRRLGWLGPAIVAFGLAVGGFGVWFMVHERPQVGDVIDTIPIEPGSEIIVRAEANGDRSFVELHVGDETKWQALVPPYAGRRGVPGIAWSPSAVSIRVVRNGHAEVFAITMNDASKLGGMRLAPNHGPIATDAPGPLTLTDHIRSYELVAGPDWHQLVGIDLASGNGLWRVELGATPVSAAGLEPGRVWILQGQRKRAFQVFNGTEILLDNPS